MDLLDKLDAREKRDILRFHKSHFMDKEVSALEEMEWTAEAMELVSATKLKDKEKKQLVIALHADLASFTTNGFKGDFKIGKAVEFVWDTHNQRYGIRVRKKGFLKSCLPCCSECSCVYDVDDNVMHVDAEPIVPEEKGEEKGGGKGDIEIVNVEDNDIKDDDVVTVKDDDVNVHVHLDKGDGDGDVVVNLNVQKDDDQVKSSGDQVTQQ